MRKQYCHGFTLIELILVISILSILAVSALPRFVNTTTEAREVSRDGVVGALRSGIMLYRANDMVVTGQAPGRYPPTLDEATNEACGAANLCFTEVLNHGIDDFQWVKVSDTEYTYNDGDEIITYSYDPDTGIFGQE